MAKQNTLPSVDGGATVVRLSEKVTRASGESIERTVEFAEQTAGSEGYMTGQVSAKMIGPKGLEQKAKFRTLRRWLEDSGKTLSDGTPVGEKANRVILWLIENSHRLMQ